jgi:hypothetical protein
MESKINSFYYDLDFNVDMPLKLQMPNFPYPPDLSDEMCTRNKAVS